MCKLNKDEITICKILHAKWVSSDDDSLETQLWSGKPREISGRFYPTPDVRWIGTIGEGVFLRVHPGDCVEVPHE